MDVAAGVVCVTEFCAAENSMFSGYINYIDRDEATRTENMKKYDLFSEYQEYMTDEEKTTGLFTKNADRLDEKEKESLKKMFKKAQDNGSMMWQTVFSFDNNWLADIGLYDPETGILDEDRLKIATRSAVNKMLESEGLNSAVWSAAIHHNTDNYHVHVAIAEPQPTREKKEYIQYEKEKRDGKWHYKKEKNESTGKMQKIPMRDADGKILKKEEFVGKFKEKTIRMAKSEMVKELSNNKEANREINSLIRERMVKHAKENSLMKDELFREKLLDLYKRLPDNVNRNLWSYNTAVMAEYRSEIDDLTDLYIQTYHKDDFARLKEELERQSRVYKVAYGGDNDYTENKLKDLYQRMGNTILSELKDYDRKMNEDKTGSRNSNGENKKASKGMTRTKHAKDIMRESRYTLERSMRHLKRSLERDYRNFRNLQDYEKLQREISQRDEHALS